MTIEPSETQEIGGAFEGRRFIKGPRGYTCGECGRGPFKRKETFVPHDCKGETIFEQAAVEPEEQTTNEEE